MVGSNDVLHGSGDGGDIGMVDGKKGNNPLAELKF